METFILFSIFFMVLTLGLTVGWIASANFIAYMNHTRHHYEELFEKNPHPELFDSDGNIDRGEYMTLNFEPGYDPDEFDPDDVSLDYE